MDEKIVSDYYLDANRFFQLDKFEDDTRAMVDFVHDSAEIETTGFDKVAIYELAVQVAKKREANVRKAKPKKKKPKRNNNKPKKSPYGGRYAKTKMQARAVYQALVSSKNQENCKKSVVSCNSS